MEIKEGSILEFNGEYEPSNVPPKEPGFYMTIRCGLGGIYYDLNKWKDGRWQKNILDASRVIAYSKEVIQEEEVMNWCKKR